MLVANRGEVAVRVLRAARRLGLRSVAVYSDADRDAPHVAEADRAVRIGPPPAAQSYLSIEAILRAADIAGADAIHPGYGFLAESAAFATACEDGRPDVRRAATGRHRADEPERPGPPGRPRGGRPGAAGG